VKSLALQCGLAAVVAAGINASLSMAQDVPARPGIAAQISALGLDQAAVKANLEGLSHDARITYLQTLGVRLPEGVARSVIAPLADGATLQAAPMVAPVVAPMVANVRLENAGVITAAPLPAPLTEGQTTIQPWPLPGQVTILPWPLPSNGNTGIVPINRGGVISSDGKIVEVWPIEPNGGPGMTAPAQPAINK
jgi:hypothetical protein